MTGFEAITALVAAVAGAIGLYEFYLFVTA